MAKGAKKATETDGAVRFLIDGESYEIDANNLTWGEAATIEEYFDKSLEDVNLASARGTIMLAHLAMKRKNPNATLADVEALELGKLEAVEAERPTSTPATSGDRA